MKLRRAQRQIWLHMAPSAVHQRAHQVRHIRPLPQVQKKRGFAITLSVAERRCQWAHQRQSSKGVTMHPPMQPTTRKRRTAIAAIKHKPSPGTRRWCFAERAELQEKARPMRIRQNNVHAQKQGSTGYKRALMKVGPSFSMTMRRSRASSPSFFIILPDV